PEEEVVGLAYRADGTGLVAVVRKDGAPGLTPGAPGVPDGVVEVRKLGSPDVVFRTPRGDPKLPLLSPDGRWLSVQNPPAWAEVYDVETGKRVLQVSEATFDPVGFGPGGYALVVTQKRADVAPPPPYVQRV